MHTKVQFCDPKKISSDIIEKAAQLLKSGVLVAFPTETVYGLGANALDPDAVAKIFMVKGRPADNPLIVHISDLTQLKEIVEEIPPLTKLLAEKFWPGPLTILLKKKASIPPIVTAGLSTVAVRMPSHPIARALIQAADLPIAAPSANTSGRPSPTSAAHVLDDLSGKIPLILDGGPSQVGLESTVIDVQRENPLILRPGGITLEQLKEIIPNIQIYSPEIMPALEDQPPSPGMKYTHYAPKAALFLYKGPIEEMSNQILMDIQQFLTENHRIGILQLIPHQYYEVMKKKFPFLEIKKLSLNSNLEEIAANLFSSLRSFDELGVEIIFSESINPIGVGLAIMNRLNKAARRIYDLSPPT